MNTLGEITTEAGVGAELARQIAEAKAVKPTVLPPQRNGAKPFAVVPDGYNLRSLDEYVPETIIEQKVVLADVPSFVGYVNDFKNSGTRLWAQEPSIQAILDYHEPGAPAQCLHRATLSLKPSLPWQKWMAVNGKSLNQLAFAEFLEENIADVLDPPGSVLMNVISTFEAKRSVNFKSHKRLDNGQVQFAYEERLEGKGGSSVSVPTEFALILKPFEFGEPETLKARLRWRLSDEGALTFSFALDRPEDVSRAAFDKVLEAVAEETGLRVLRGTAG